MGISLRLDAQDEKVRLQGLIAKILDTAPPRGFIIRTVAEGASEVELARDVEFLKNLWLNISEYAKTVKAPTCVHEDLPLLKRAVRDWVSDEVERVRIDSQSAYEELVGFTTQFIPDVKQKLICYDNPMPIFEMYGVEAELQNALERNVPLKSGGYLVIDQTEAMTTVDVNTGAFVGGRNLEETIFKTNLEAAQAIGRQMRLRNLGGIIILDFIDMFDETHKRQLRATLEKALAFDRARTKISDISSLGLVQLTRKRTQESLQKQLCEPCSYCNGRGMLKTIETVCQEIFRDLIRESRIYEKATGFVVIAAQSVVDFLVQEEPDRMGELEAKLGRPIKIKPEPLMPREQYDIILM